MEQTPNKSFLAEPGNGLEHGTSAFEQGTSLASRAECQQELVTSAETCPHCGCPRQRITGPKCYHCENPATTRCQRCGIFACAPHLQSIVVPNRSVVHELCCQSCENAVKGEMEIGDRIANVFLALVTFGAIMFLICCAFAMNSRRNHSSLKPDRQSSVRVAMTVSSDYPPTIGDKELPANDKHHSRPPHS